MSEHLSMRSLAILATLVKEERHGYDIMRQVALDSDHRLAMGPATLYTSLKRLLEDGYIEELPERQDPKRKDVRRRYYRLSSAGKEAVEKELESLEMLSRVLKQRLA